MLKREETQIKESGKSKREERAKQRKMQYKKIKDSAFRSCEGIMGFGHF